jgi:ParB-like chromosome segregation protein Spo0J
VAKNKPDFDIEVVDLDEIRPHPRNYRTHPEEQLRHIEASIQRNGFYRPVVTANDGTILAGHGVVTAARNLGHKRIPIARLDVAPDDPLAIQVLTGDNEIGRLSMPDDRLLTELLREISETEYGLDGTGYDEEKLAALVMVTRTAEEIEDFDAAAEWVGMPEFDIGGQVYKLIVQFESMEDRDRFCADKGVEARKTSDNSWSTWWPNPEQEQTQTVEWVDAD